ncbi:MAG: tyrosine-type recombinase/integrase [Pseudomonadota bacterium]
MSRKRRAFEWPAADRAMWSSLFRHGGPLDGKGPLAHVRATSRECFQRVYASWLAWIAHDDPDALALDPVSRAGGERMQRWFGSMAGYAPKTRLTQTGHLLRILSAFAPAANWSVQRRVVALARRAVEDTPSGRKTDRILSSDVLFESGLSLIARNGTYHPPQTLAEAKRQRDGMMIAFLALLPLRRRAFCGLDLGGAALRRGASILVHLAPERTKSGQAWESPLPAALIAPMQHYLAHVRPWLMARSGSRHTALWVNDKGRPYYEPHLSARIPRITGTLFGTNISIHLFRDAAATTLAHHSPDAARLTRAILGHSGFRTAERHYNQARTIEAGRRYSEVIARLKETPA